MACDKTGETWKVLRISFHLNVMSFTTGGTQYEVHHVPALIFLYLKELSIVLHMPSAVKSHSTFGSIVRVRWTPGNRTGARWNRLLVRRLPHSLRFTMLSAQGMCNPSSPWVSRDRSVSLRSTFLTTGASGVCRTERWRPATETRVNDERHLTTDGQSDDEKWVTAVPLANDERNPSLTKETWHS